MRGVQENRRDPWERSPYLSALEVWSRQGAVQIHIYLYHEPRVCSDQFMPVDVSSGSFSSVGRGI